MSLGGKKKLSAPLTEKKKKNNKEGNKISPGDAYSKQVVLS